MWASQGRKVSDSKSGRRTHAFVRDQGSTGEVREKIVEAHKCDARRAELIREKERCLFNVMLTSQVMLWDCPDETP